MCLRVQGLVSLKPKPQTALPQTPGCQLLVFKGSGFSVFKGSGLSVLEAWLPARHSEYVFSTPPLTNVFSLANVLLMCC